MNKNQIFLFVAFFFTIAIGQIDYNFSYELKYGTGSQILRDKYGEMLSTVPYEYNEHLLDVNLFYEDIYVYSLLEFSEPPVFGKSTLGFNKLFLEYETDNLYTKAGNLVVLYGRGLTIGTGYDQVIDFDNTLNGVELRYNLNDYASLFTVNGYSDFSFRSAADKRESDQELGLNVNMAGLDFSSESFGDIQLFGIIEKQQIDNVESLIVGSNYFTDELSDRFYDVLIESGADSLKDEIKHYSFDLNHTASIFDFDFYYEIVFQNYQKIVSDDFETGINKYISVYREFGDFGVTYEYKDYYSPMRIKTISAPPTVFKETNSALLSRSQHKINFLNETGHQLEINRKFSKYVNFMLNIGLASSRPDYSDFSDIINSTDQLKFIDYFSNKFSSDENIIYHPYRQAYFQFDGLIFSDKLHYKLGVDYFHEIKVYDVQAFTLPTHFVIDFFNKRSIVLYYEYQSANERNYKTNNLSKTKTHYSSTTFNYKSWHLSFFMDAVKVKDKDFKFWLGTNLTWNFTSTSMLSVFYGSQKGGLVCANGVCANQPDFDDGLKISLRTSF